jgi:hypothetical protein
MQVRVFAIRDTSLHLHDSTGEVCSHARGSQQIISLELAMNTAYLVVYPRACTLDQ